MRDKITPLILTYNEAPNISRTLDKLLWAHRIVVVDSGSNDGTIEILRRYPQVEVVKRPFADAASQCNFGLTQVKSQWVLSLDADYELSDELISDLAALTPSRSTMGYRTCFVYRVFGRPLRRSLYPPRTVLYRKDKASYRQEGHTQRVVIDGEVSSLNGVIYHDDRKPLSRWIESQQAYARAEAEYLLNSSRAMLRRTDKIRLIGWPAPIGIFFYTLFLKGCLLDGWAGWYYALQRTIAEMMLALEIADRRLGGKRVSGRRESGK